MGLINNRDRLDMLGELMLQASGARGITVILDPRPSQIGDTVGRLVTMTYGSVTEDGAPAEQTTRQSSDEKPYPKPSTAAGADRAGEEAKTWPGVMGAIAAGKSMSDMPRLEGGAEIGMCRSPLAVIAAEIADVAKDYGIWASVNISVSLDGRPDVADESESE